MTSSKTALEAFEQEKAAILALLVKFAPNLQAYDREISSARGGHSNWQHAGSLEFVRQQIEGALETLTNSRAATRGEATNHSVQRGDGRRVRVSVPRK
jgi:hypothetical protein